eukprot:2379713-Amphidinium_carterae.1
MEKVKRNWSQDNTTASNGANEPGARQGVPEPLLAWFGHLPRLASEPLMEFRAQQMQRWKPLRVGQH